MEPSFEIQIDEALGAVGAQSQNSAYSNLTLEKVKSMDIKQLRGM
jgi:hypothetical protein